MPGGRDVHGPAPYPCESALVGTLWWSSGPTRQRMEFGQGRLIGTTTFVLDGAQQVEDRDGNGVLMRQNVFGPSIENVILADDFGCDMLAAAVVQGGPHRG